MDMDLGKLQEMVEAWHVAAYEIQRVGHDLATGQQQQKHSLDILYKP